MHEPCDCLTCRIMATIHDHANDWHEADRESDEPRINAAEVITALGQIEASLILQASSEPLQHALSAYRDQVFEAAITSARTGVAQPVEFIAPGAAH